MKLPNPTPTLVRLNPHLFNPVPAQPPSREADLHHDILAECRRRGWLAMHGSTAHRTHRTPGEPDFVILCDGGRLLLVECKTRTGKLSPAQTAVRAHAARLGHTIHIVRSMADFVQLTQSNTNNNT